MALQFINQAAIGGGPCDADRRIIRSHVMKGRNAGRPRRAKKKSTILHVKRIPNFSHLSALQSSKAGRPLLWNDLCLTSFPQQLDSESTKLMHRCASHVLHQSTNYLLVFAYVPFSGFFDISDALFPPQFCSKFDMIKSIWVNYILADEACELDTRCVHSTTLIPCLSDFHCTLAVSASYVDFFQRKPAISPKTLHHISQAYALVNLKLSGPESVSDSAIAAVVTLTIYQQIHHLPAIGLIHLNGLYRMIQLRGGIARLMKENRALALKPLRYV